MVELIIGNKGKGKTKHILDRATADLKEAHGDIVFIDKDQKHIFGLNNKIRLIDMTDYDINSTEEFVGFLNGVISLNHDIEEIILDSFLTIACINGDDVMIETIEKIEGLSEKHDVKFLLSVSRNKEELPGSLSDKVVLAL